MAGRGEFALVEPFFNIGVFWVVFEIGFEVVTVLLFFFGETAEEVGVVIDLTFVPTVEHAFFAAVVVVGVGELASFELLDAVEETIEFFD